MEGLIGASTDTETTATIFGSLAKLTDIKSNVKKAKGGAEAALGEIQGVRQEIGAKGQTPVVYERLKKLEAALKELKTSAEAISESQVESGALASEMIDKLSNVLNESAKAVGLEGTGVEAEGLTKEEAIDNKKISDKLDEIRAKLEALKESVETQDVVIKTYFEGGGE